MNADNIKYDDSGLKKLKRYFWVAIFIWTNFILIIAGIDYLKTKHYSEESARVEARSLYQKDIVFRQWNSKHGGVYAPISKWSPPNKYLADYPNRDVTTTDGMKLTLINPAYMTRQMHEIGKDQFGVISHITSLNLIRPENAADSWETKALYAFKSGEAEVSSIEKIEEKEYMRLMKPLKVEESCLKCHSNQDYKVGEVRGGISVSVPMESRREIMMGELLPDAIIIISVWIIGMSMIVITLKKEKRLWFNRRLLERNRAERDKLESVHKLAGAVAHEFRQPLTVLKILSGLSIEEIILDKDMLHITLSQQVRTIDDLITKLLSITSVEMRSYANNQEILDFNKSSKKKIR